MRVEHREVRDYDWNGQRNSQNTGQCAERSNKHSQVGLGRHVSISHGGHGDDRPP